MTRHFLTLNDCSADELRGIITRAIELKAMTAAGEIYEPLKNRTLAMLFEKSSTRTRVSFEVGMAQFGGHALFLSPKDTQIGRGEPVADTARVLSRMVDAIMVRNHSHELLQTLAANSRVPVINGLTDRFHPCQLLADLQTWWEQRGDIAGATVAWIGDGNNMCHSYINAAIALGFKLNIGCPMGYEPEAELLERAGNTVALTHDPRAAAAGADLVVTDVWASMGDEDEATQRLSDFKGFIVDETMMSGAHKEALFMHCLPAHRGEEVAAAVIDGPHSVVWDEAENRLHAQKSLLEFLLKP